MLNWCIGSDHGLIPALPAQGLRAVDPGLASFLGTLSAAHACTHGGAPDKLPTTYSPASPPALGGYLTPAAHHQPSAAIALSAVQHHEQDEAAVQQQRRQQARRGAAPVAIAAQQGSRGSAGATSEIVAAVPQPAAGAAAGTTAAAAAAAGISVGVAAAVGAAMADGRAGGQEPRPEQAGGRPLPPMPPMPIIAGSSPAPSAPRYLTGSPLLTVLPPAPSRRQYSTEPSPRDGGRAPNLASIGPTGSLHYTSSLPPPPLPYDSDRGSASSSDGPPAAQPAATGAGLVSGQRQPAAGSPQRPHLEGAALGGGGGGPRGLLPPPPVPFDSDDDSPLLPSSPSSEGGLPATDPPSPQRAPLGPDMWPGASGYRADEAQGQGVAGMTSALPSRIPQGVSAAGALQPQSAGMAASRQDSSRGSSHPANGSRIPGPGASGAQPAMSQALASPMQSTLAAPTGDEQGPGQAAGVLGGMLTYPTLRRPPGQARAAPAAALAGLQEGDGSVDSPGGESPGALLPRRGAAGARAPWGSGGRSDGGAAAAGAAATGVWSRPAALAMSYSAGGESGEPLASRSLIGSPAPVLRRPPTAAAASSQGEATSAQLAQGEPSPAEALSSTMSGSLPPSTPGGTVVYLRRPPGSDGGTRPDAATASGITATARAITATAASVWLPQRLPRPQQGTQAPQTSGATATQPRNSAAPPQPSHGLSSLPEITAASDDSDEEEDEAPRGSHAKRSLAAATRGRPAMPAAPSPVPQRQRQVSTPAGATGAATGSEAVGPNVAGSGAFQVPLLRRPPAPAASTARSGSHLTGPAPVSSYDDDDDSGDDSRRDMPDESRLQTKEATKGIGISVVGAGRRPLPPPPPPPRVVGPAPGATTLAAVASAAATISVPSAPGHDRQAAVTLLTPVRGSLLPTAATPSAGHNAGVAARQRRAQDQDAAGGKAGAGDGESTRDYVAKLLAEMEREGAR